MGMTTAERGCERRGLVEPEWVNLGGRRVSTERESSRGDWGIQAQHRPDEGEILDLPRVEKAPSRLEQNPRTRIVGLDRSKPKVG
mmetsp:Transcript_10144/g.20497  ORF Transcript_10144/g.20497 Transcript_10144/m.20497 type:complete len:85 (+) Transcript_10144:237-491(+)|eukprot:CAMPEP_0184679406 /NCGR_PEP_ID=MMETSP0312-20130426/2238_1 /TAXON_ID=31354 /ORGANISM="Compsopogon coeruleus, Strain SAG 36.94" /LENGTH=84 /DNA_ID=CAMNT_0027128823 /DNA_START=221 /DNA_END=475 /DNA_ORIENTATION=+